MNNGCKIREGHDYYYSGKGYNYGELLQMAEKHKEAIEAKYKSKLDYWEHTIEYLRELVRSKQTLYEAPFMEPWWKPIFKCKEARQEEKAVK